LNGIAESISTTVRLDENIRNVYHVIVNEYPILLPLLVEGYVHQG